MRISADQLSAFSGGPDIPPAVEPPLSLTEEVVLLSDDAPRRLVKHVAKIIGRAYPNRPRDYAGALAAIAGDPPPAVVALANDLALDPAQLVERLLPARRDTGGKQFGSSVYPSLAGP